MTADGTSVSHGDRPVLVTGAAGFLGSRVVALLSGAGREVIATDVVDDERGQKLARMPGVAYVTADLRDSEAIATLVRRCGYLVHLAAMRRRVSQRGGRAPFEVNVAATYTLLGAAHSLEGVVYGSSHLVYGDFRDADRWYGEADATPAPGLSLYAAAKLSSESFVAAFADEFDLNHLCLRFGGIYGPNPAPGSTNSLMADVLTSLDRGERPIVEWSRDTTHSLIYVDDAARAVVAALGFPVSGGAINVVGQPETAEAIYAELLTQYGADPGMLTWVGDRRRCQQVRNERLVNELRCPPETSLADGLSAIIDWHRGRQV